MTPRQIEVAEEALASLTDYEIEARRSALPKWKNDMTVEQIAEADALYAEQLCRYKAGIVRYNQEAIAATGLALGDRVSWFAVSWTGLGGTTYKGVVAKNKAGRLVVRLDEKVNGRRTVAIQRGFKKH